MTKVVQIFNCNHKTETSYGALIRAIVKIMDLLQIKKIIYAYKIILLIYFFQIEI